MKVKSSFHSRGKHPIFVPPQNFFLRDQSRTSPLLPSLSDSSTFFDAGIGEICLLRKLDGPSLSLKERFHNLQMITLPIDVLVDEKKARIEKLIDSMSLHRIITRETDREMCEAACRDMLFCLDISTTSRSLRTILHEVIPRYLTVHWDWHHYSQHA